MNIIIAPDKFKSSLSSFEVCEALKQGILQTNPSAHIFSFPMADGGDGFANVMSHYINAQSVWSKALDPLGREINCSYQWDERGQTAIIELAAASGLALLREEEKDPLHTSTRGTGLLIADAINKGAKKIVLGLGGSATNDAGTGILAAMGFHFTDEEGKDLLPNGENLDRISRILLPSSLAPIHFEIACDVQNTLFGEQGAAYIYAPQKGADNEAVALLDRGLRRYASLLALQTGKNVSTAPGIGAAGGVAASLLAFFPSLLKQGIELVIAASGIEKKLNEADLLITGEGKIDGQSLSGKVVGSLARLAQQHAVPCVACCGILDMDPSSAAAMGLKKVIAIRDSAASVQESVRKAAALLRQRAGELLTG